MVPVPLLELSCSMDAACTFGSVIFSGADCRWTTQPRPRPCGPSTTPWPATMP